MSASHALLGILDREPSYGYDLKRHYDALFGTKEPLAFGQVYATLARLLRDKKITATAAERVAGPERKKYAITPIGRKELEDWLQTAEKLHPETRSVLFMKVITAILLDEDPNIFLDTQRAAHIARMRELTVLRRQGNLSDLLRTDYALFHLEADLRWIELTTARLTALTKEVRDEQQS